MGVNKNQSLARFRRYSGFFVLTVILICLGSGAEAVVRHVNPNQPGCEAKNNQDFDHSGFPGANGVLVYCSITDAITYSETDDTIYIAPNPGGYRESLVLNQTPSRSLTIIGSGVSTTIIDSSSRAFLIREDATIKHLTMDAIGPPKGGQGGAIHMLGDIVVNVQDVVIKNANASNGGGIYVESGSLNLLRVAIINNTASIDAMDSNAPLPAGGGIYVGSAAILTAVDSAIIDNTALQIGGEGGNGAGLYNLGTSTLINTTVSGNTATASNRRGGGIVNGEMQLAAELNLYHVTVANNSTSNNGGGIYNFNGTVNVKNSIIANNTDNGTAPNCGANNNGFVSQDYNVVGCDSTVFTAAANDIEVTASTPLNLLPLPAIDPAEQYYGMPVFMFNDLDVGSVAIDSVDINSCLDPNNSPLTNDQRGTIRPFDGDNDATSNCDAGAVELADDIIIYPTHIITFEDQGTTTFYVALAKAPATGQTVQLSIASQMIAEGQIAPGSESLSFDESDWNVPKAVQINVQNDGSQDGDQPYTVNVSTSDINVATKQVTITNIDTIIPPGLLVEPANINISEGGQPAILRIRLATQPAAGSTVHVQIANDLADGTNDQETLSTKDLNYDDTNWSTFQEVIVSAVDDTVADGSISYNLVVSVANDSTDSSFLGMSTSVPITVNDNEQANGSVGVSFPGLPSNLTTTEDGGEVTFNVVLDSAPSADVTVNLVSNATSEGMLLNGQTQQQALPLVFTPQNWNQPQAVTVVGVDDIYADGGRNYRILIQTISDDTFFNGLDIPDIRITNNDNEEPGIIASPTSGLVTSEDGTSATFQVRLSSPPAPGLQVVLTAAVQPPGSGEALEGYVILPVNQLVFNSDNYNQPQSVTVTGMDDCTADGDKNYEIIVSQNTVSTTSPPYINFAQPQSVAVTNQDNDLSPTSQIVVSKTQMQTSENLTSDSIDLCLTSQPTAPVTVTMTIPSGFSDEGLFSSGLDTAEITFDQNNWTQPINVVVAGQDDSDEDGDQAYQIDIAPAVSLDPTYANMTLPAVSVTNIDNDTGVVIPPPTTSAGLVFDSQTNPAVKTFVTGENGDSDTIKVKLTQAPTDEVRVKFTIPDGDRNEGRFQDSDNNMDFVKTLVFTAANWSTQLEVTIIGRDDTVVDGDHLYTISIDTSESLAPEFQSISLPQIRVINQDDDNVRVKPNNPNSGGALNLILLWLLGVFVWVRHHGRISQSLTRH